VFAILIAMLVIVALAALVVTYVAFPHRGEEVPGAPWLGDAMAKGVEALPNLDESEHVNPTQSPSAEQPDEQTDGRGDEPGPRHAL